MAIKDSKTVIVEYVSSLSDDQLQFVTTRLVEKLGGDLAEALEEMSKDKKIDDVLSDASSAENLYNILDNIRDVAVKELKKRDVSAVAS